MAATLSPGNCSEDVRRVVEGLRRRHPAAEVEASPSSGGPVVLHRLAVPKDRRGAGLGSAVMRDLAAEADGRGWTLALTPSTDFGGSSRRRLEGFYRRFGFVANRGRRRDFTTTEAMIRRPREERC